MPNDRIEKFFQDSNYQMANISKKPASLRRAVAMGCITVGEKGFQHIKNKNLPKGDALQLAEIAGIQAAKNSWQQIPLCHPLTLDHVAIHTELEAEEYSVRIFSTVITTAKTGVEMEALAAVNAALLTIYDLTKPVEPALTISEIRLLLKEGGKKGCWIHPLGIPAQLQEFINISTQPQLSGITAAVITLSDRAYNGEYADKSGQILQEELTALGCEIKDYTILPDEADMLEQKLANLAGKVDLIITTGGTGIAPRDITPETIEKLANISIPGIGELLRSASAHHITTSWLSRSYAAVIDDSLVIALPGSTGGVKDGINLLKDILPHALAHVQDKRNIHEGH